MLGLFSGIALFFLPWLKILFQYRAAGVNDWISSPGVAVLLQTFQFFIYGSGWIYLIILSLATPSLFFVIKKEKEKAVTSKKAKAVKKEKPVIEEPVVEEKVEAKIEEAKVEEEKTNE